MPKQELMYAECWVRCITESSGHTRHAFASNASSAIAEDSSAALPWLKSALHTTENTLTAVPANATRHCIAHHHGRQLCHIASQRHGTSNFTARQKVRGNATGTPSSGCHHRHLHPPSSSLHPTTSENRDAATVWVRASATMSGSG